jgi:cell division protease FtsH
MPQRLRTFLVWFLLVVVFAAIYMLLSEDPSVAVGNESEATFLADLAANRIARVSVDEDNRVYATRHDGTVYRTDAEYDEPLYEQLARQNIEIGWWRENREETSGPSSLLMIVGVVFLILAILFFVLRKRGTENLLSLRRTTARLVSETPKVGWDDVGGATEAKTHLRDTLDFLANPRKWEAAGARAPRGILLEGPPGFGKTLLAKALAGEAKLPFFEVSGSEFVELFVGVGAARVRDLFDEAKKKAPCVVFIDELDAIGRKRGGAGASLTHQEREQALDQMLVCLDGFRSRDRVVVLAATNRADVLDPALLRPGRFDMTIRVGDFSDADRLAVLKVHTKNKPLAPDVDLARIAAACPDASGADLEHICNATAMRAVRRGEQPLRITSEDFEHVLEARKPKNTELDQLDAFLVEANTGLAQTTSRLMVEIALRSADQVAGQIVWADPLCLKLKTSDGAVVLGRSDIVSIRVKGAAQAITTHDLARAHVIEQLDAS